MVTILFGYDLCVRESEDEIRANPKVFEYDQCERKLRSNHPKVTIQIETTFLKPMQQISFKN